LIEISDNEFGLLKDYLGSVCGIDVPSDKRYLFVTRLAELLAELGCSSFSDLYRRLTVRDDHQLRTCLVEAMTTNETSFYRDQHPFVAMSSTILPELARRRSAKVRGVPPRIRIWSVGCSTGEEPFSIAISVHEWLARQQRFSPGDVSIVAGDISKRVLAHARRGIYAAGRLDKLPLDLRGRYFRPVADGYLVREDIRAMVYFAELNLIDTLEQLGFFDVVFCRNVMIYFSVALKVKVLAQLCRMLHPGGVLVMGASENLYGLSDALRPMSVGQTTYYRKEDGSG